MVQRGAWVAGAIVALAAMAPSARADYMVLQSGQRIHVTGYERVGDTVRLTMSGGTLEIPADSVVSVDPEDTFLPAKIQSLDVPFANFISESARVHGVAPELVASVIAVESNFNPNAVSWRYARGLMQLMPQTAARFGVTKIFDPQQNIDAGTRYLKELLVRYKGDLSLTLAAYNAGPERVEQYRAVPPYRETRDYIRRVTEKFRTAYHAANQIADLQ
ncbi:MAG TPA: lytic transglycosylase domain-containing protein [Candidatus Saccharimonadales bacterium]|nr:lytic transglycosylase domain-containing protein [Candidatus Saccharimonadales bacterium]